MPRKIVTIDEARRTSSARSGTAGTGRQTGNGIQMTRHPLSVLLLSADAGQIESLCRNLKAMESFDANIVTAGSVAGARTIATQYDFDVLLLDGGMADVDGFGLVRKMTQSESSCAPILIAGDAAPAANRQPPLPGALSVLQLHGLSPEILSAAIVKALAEAQRREALFAQLQAQDRAVSDGGGGDRILPWLRGLLGEINQIHGGASLALGGLHRGEDQESGPLLQSAVGRSDRLRTDLLDTINRIQADRLAKRRTQDVDVAKLLSHVVQDYRSDAEQRGQTLRYQRPDLPLLLSANAQSVCDVFRIILRNTIRNTAPDTQIDVALSIRSGDVCISVRDTSPDGHWTSKLHGAAVPSDETVAALREKAGGIILINELVRECNGSIDVVAAGDAQGSDGAGPANELRCFFPRNRTA